MTSNGTRDIAICGFGAVTPLGRRALSNAAAVRAGITGFINHPLMTDSEGRPVQVAMCPWLTPDAPVAYRISDCLLEAIAEAVTPLVSNVEQSAKFRLLVLVNLPLDRPGLPPNLLKHVEAELGAQLASLTVTVALARQGHAGGAAALSSAIAALTAGKADACIVAGADSYMELETLEWLEDTEQLHGAGARNNAWGFVPGEGAGAIAVLARSSAERLGLRPLGYVAAVGLDVEHNRIRSGQVCLGEGLGNAFHRVLQGVPAGRQVSDTYCDMNGDPYRADEYGFAVMRTREFFDQPSEFLAPADCWGDVGAASVPLYISLAVIASQKSYARGDVTLVWASSDSGVRGAVLLVDR